MKGSAFEVFTKSEKAVNLFQKLPQITESLSSNGRKVQDSGSVFRTKMERRRTGEKQFGQRVTNKTYCRRVLLVSQAGKWQKICSVSDWFRPIHSFFSVKLQFQPLISSLVQFGPKNLI